MAGKYYAPGHDRAARVGELFARIAPRYDLINDLQSGGLHRWWKQQVVALARPGPGLKALDVCCGTGDLALALSRRGATVTGLDFSEAMLAVARQRAARHPAHPAPHYQCGDAQQLPDRKSTRLNSSHGTTSRMPSSA